MGAADHREAIGRSEIAGRRQLADRLFASIDQVRIDFIGVGKGPDTQHAIFRLQRDFDPIRDMVRDQRRDADSQIHIIAVF